MDKLATPQTRLVKPKTKRGRRILQAREPKAVEDVKRALMLFGSTTSQVIKDVMTDLQKMKGIDVQKFTRKNRDIRPFETGGEASLQFYASKSECGLFALASHSKKRPHNLTIGRMYDSQLYDCIELGVDQFKSMRTFGSAAAPAQAGNKPCIMFVGEKFESVVALQQAKSVLLDFFRGQQVDSINLAGVDRVIVAVARDDTRIMLRQYVIRLKKSGTSVPRVALTEMGPRLDFSMRRNRMPPTELEKEALKQPKLGKKKEKNVHSDAIDGKIGRIYMPKQKVDEMALAKPKGVRREKREKKRDSVEARKAGAPKPLAAGAVRGSGGDDRRAAAASGVARVKKAAAPRDATKRRSVGAAPGPVGGVAKKRRRQIEAM